jgi:hypothetical protein
VTAAEDAQIRQKEPVAFKVGKEKHFERKVMGAEAVR